ncbi:MAG: 2-dehydropantoate 2-reductase [Thermomicrobiales bacterium]
MRITIVGAGAMGSLIAARLTQAMASAAPAESQGDAIERVLLYSRPSAHLDAVQAHGLHLIEQDGREQTIAIETVSDPAAVKGSDVVIVLVKSWATAGIGEMLRPYLTRDTIVLTLQNGLGNASALRTSLLDKGVRPHVWLGVTTQAAIRPEPGVLVHRGTGITAIGRRTTMNDRVRALASTLDVPNWRTVAVEDIHRWVWRKLAVNCAINPLTALAGLPNSAIVSDPGLHDAANRLAAEVVAVANAQRVSLDLSDVISAIEDVAIATGTNTSSMLVDLEHGQRTEIDAINGAVVAEGLRLGIPTPANALMTALIRARERLAVTPDADGALQESESAAV